MQHTLAKQIVGAPSQQEKPTSSLHDWPSFPQPQMPPPHALEQQSVDELQGSPSGLQADAQLPFTQFWVRQSALDVQAPCSTMQRLSSSPPRQAICESPPCWQQSSPPW